MMLNVKRRSGPPHSSQHLLTETMENDHLDSRWVVPTDAFTDAVPPPSGDDMSI